MSCYLIVLITAWWWLTSSEVDNKDNKIVSACLYFLLLSQHKSVCTHVLFRTITNAPGNVYYDGASYLKYRLVFVFVFFFKWMSTSPVWHHSRGMRSGSRSQRRRRLGRKKNDSGEWNFFRDRECVRDATYTTTAFFFLGKKKRGGGRGGGAGVGEKTFACQLHLLYIFFFAHRVLRNNPFGYWRAIQSWQTARMWTCKMSTFNSTSQEKHPSWTND